MRLDTELFQAVIEVQQAVRRRGSIRPPSCGSSRSGAPTLTGASGVVIETLEGEGFGPAAPDRHRESAGFR